MPLVNSGERTRPRVLFPAPSPETSHIEASLCARYAFSGAQNEAREGARSPALSALRFSRILAQHADVAIADPDCVNGRDIVRAKHDGG